MASRRTNTGSSVTSSRKSVVSTRRSSIIGKVNSSRFGLSQSRRDAKIDRHADVITKHNVRVFHDGQDVTPKSLLSSSVKEARMEMEKSESRAKINANFNFNDSRAFGPPPELQSTYNGGASTFVASCATGLNQSIMGSMVRGSMVMSSRASLDSVTSDLSSESNTGVSGAPCVADVNVHLRDESEIITSSDLEKIVYVTLMETETIPLFEMDAILVSNLDEEAEAVIKRNEEYAKLCSLREGNDKYMSRGMQTFNDDFKTKEMQTNAVDMKDIGSMVTNYDLFDTYNEKEVTENEDDIEEDIGAMITASRKKSKMIMTEDGKNVEQSYAVTSVSEFSQAESVLITSQTSASPIPKVISKYVEDEEAQMERLSKLESMKENLFIMERTVVQNNYHPKQQLYRGIKDLKFLDESKGGGMGNIFDIVRAASRLSNMQPNISRLWAYECASTKGLHATCMTWNKTNEDILAVGYGSQETFSSGKGLVCIWSIKNPEYPERLYTMNHAVTALDFSESRPNLLAVGLFNGGISLYSIRDSVDRSVLDSADNPGRHTAPVWQLKWVTRDKGTGDEKGEILVSGGGDGRVIQWTIIKGFESCDLMKVKRTSTSKISQKKGGPAKKSDAFILRFSPAMCFDFNWNDNNIYLVGSEDMNVHRCSYSYNEQFLESYAGHHGPVYKVRWSPFLSDVFLTCSADWSVRLWHVNKPDPVLVFQAATKAVIDIDWCPFSSTVFACISENQIEIWDLALSILDPIVVNVPVSKVALTSAVFALNAKVLLVGDCEGFVTVYQLSEMNLDTHHQDKEYLMDIVKSSLPKSINSYQDV